MSKRGIKNLVFIALTSLIVTVVLSSYGGGSKKPTIGTIASDACITCHLQADVINLMYKPPEESAGGGG